MCHFQCQSKDALLEHRKSCQKPDVDSKDNDSTSAKRPEENSASSVAGISFDGGTSSCANIAMSDGDFGFKITNVCSMAPEPSETEIDGFEMECEEIEEERQSDVEESDGETATEPVTSQIIIPQRPVMTKAKYTQKTTTTTTGQTVIYVSPTTPSVNSNTPASISSTTQMCTVINSDGRTTLVPQSIVPVPLDAKDNIPVVFQASKNVTETVPVTKTKTKTADSQKTITTPPNSGLKLITVNPHSKETKVWYIPAGGLNTVSANVNSTSSVNLNPVTSGIVFQPASVVNQSAKPNVLAVKSNSTKTLETNTISLMASKSHGTVTTTGPLSSAPKVVKIPPPTPVSLQTTVNPIQSVVRGSTPGQIVLPTAVSLQRPPLQAVTAAPQFSTLRQPVHQVVSGQLQLAVPLQTTGNQPGVNPMQQIVLLTNPPSSKTTTSVNVNQLPVAFNQGGKIQLIPTINAKPQVIVTQSKSATQPSVSNVASNVTLPSKCIPVIFAPVSQPGPGKTELPILTAAAKPQASGKSTGSPRQLPLALHTVKGNGKGKPETVTSSELKLSNQILYITRGDNQVTIHKLPLPSAKPATASTKTKSSTKTNSSTKIKPSITGQDGRSPTKPKQDIVLKVMVNQETDTEDLKDKPSDKQLIIVPRTQKILPRKKQKLKTDKEDEARRRIVPDPEIDNPNVRRSSRIREKPRKSYAEENSDENDDEEDEEEEEEEEGESLTQEELEAKTGAATQTEISEMDVDEEMQPKGLPEKDELPEEKDQQGGDVETRVKRKHKNDDNDPDFAPDELEEKASDSDFEINEDDDDDDDDFDFQKSSKAKRKRVQRYPEVSLEDHSDKFSVEDKPVKGDPERKLYSCKMCSIGFSCITASAMEGHLSKHLSGKFACPHCDFNDVTTNLSYHISSKHPETLPCICSKCGNGFMTKERLRAHMSRVHKDYILSCEKCGKGFTFGRQLQRHMHKHHGEDMLSCPKCGKLFSSKFYYKKHLRLATDCAQRPCLCQECGAIVASKHMLQEHRRRVHQKERNYMCNICSFTCFRMHQLREHMPVHTGMYRKREKICVKLKVNLFFTTDTIFIYLFV